MQQKPQIIALNGWQYSIGKFLPGAKCPNELRWTLRKAEAFAKTLEGPTILIGFSRGATAALRVAQLSPHVTKVIAHSPTFRPQLRIPYQVSVMLCRTKGDRTPTWHGTFQTWRSLQSHGSNATIDEYRFLDWEPASTVERAMINLKHCFHNCLGDIEKYVPEALAGQAPAGVASGGPPPPPRGGFGSFRGPPRLPRSGRF